jgi:hypothetical protein
MTRPVSSNETPAAFSYHEYRQILEAVGPKLKDYSAARQAAAFTILRHDVEFSVSRAYRMARIEQEHGVCSSYFFQVLSSAYNPLSVENRTLIRRIRDMGHHVGLHLYVSHIEEGDWRSVTAELAAQKQIFETGLGIACARFSFHRPPAWTLENRQDEIAGVMNTYGASFFEFSPRPETIKYIADSKHQWSYGHPLDDFPQQKVQILIHPDEWSEDGGDIKDTFKALIDEHRAGFIETMDNETQRFSTYRGELQ